MPPLSTADRQSYELLRKVCTAANDTSSPELALALAFVQQLETSQRTEQIAHSSQMLVRHLLETDPAGLEEALQAEQDQDFVYRMRLLMGQCRPAKAV